MNELKEIIEGQRAFFYGGASKIEAFRRESLEKLESLLEIYEDDILLALNKDLGKSNF